MLDLFSFFQLLNQKHEKKSNVESAKEKCDRR